MKPNPVKPAITVDRLATADEIRAAIFPFPDPLAQCDAEILHEIATDLGGYERIAPVEFEASLMVEELAGAEDVWPN